MFQTRSLPDSAARLVCVIRPFKSLIRPFKGLIRVFKGLFKVLLKAFLIVFHFLFEALRKVIRMHFTAF